MQEFEDSTIRRFLLGDLDEDNRTKIESEAIAADDLFARIEVIEDEIIEEYLAGKLPGSERRIFDETLDTVPGRRRRVELVRTLAARKPATPAESNVVTLNERLRFASHARFAIAAGFAAAAITAFIFIQTRQSATDGTGPAESVVSAPDAAPSTAPPTQPNPETSSALAVRRPGSPILAAPDSPVDSLAATSVVTFVLTTGTVRSGEDERTLDLAPGIDVVDFEIAVDDNEFAHYNAELRAPDGTSVASKRDIAVTAQAGAPVIRFRVSAAALRAGRHELVLAGVHERGAEEVAYIEFDVRKR